MPTWWYNNVTGVIEHQTNALVQASLYANPVWKGFGTQAAAKAWQKSHKPVGASLPGAGTVKQGMDGAQAAAKAVDVQGFLGAMTNPNTWLRTAEVMLGLVLIVVGLVKLTPPGVTKNVKTIGKVAALL